VVGTACCFVPMTMCATAGVAARDAGLASGLLNSSRQIGSALFLAILATVATSETASILRSPGHGGKTLAQAMASGYDRGLLLTGVLALGISLVGATVIPRLPKRQADAEAAGVAVESA
jgi:hypothetical protein